MENTSRNNEATSAESATPLRLPKNRFDGTTGLRELMLLELQGLYFSEKLWVKAFPKIIKNASSFDLIETISQHAEATKKQIIRLEDIFEEFREKPLMQRSLAMEYLLEDIEQMIDATKFGIVRDAGIVLSLHKLEHWEIGVYSTLEIYAENLQLDNIQQWIQDSLNEEKVAQMRLAKIATSLRYY